MNFSDRKTNRLSGFNYSRHGKYFITTCVKGRQRVFGVVKNDTTILNNAGLVVKKVWKWLAFQYPYVQLDEFVVMPNHFHGILIIKKSFKEPLAGTGRDLSLQEVRPQIESLKIKSVSELVGAFKMKVSKLIHETGNHEFKWQRSFHDHIIQTNQQLYAIRQYIRSNPLNWQEDEFYV